MAPLTKVNELISKSFCCDLMYVSIFNPIANKVVSIDSTKIFISENAYLKISFEK